MDQIPQAFNALSEKLSGWLQALIKSLPNIALALFVVFVFWIVSRWVYNLVRSLFTKTELSENLEHLLANCVRIGVILVGVVLALGILQLDKTVFSLLAGVGVLGLALGFAFQDLAANFVSGVLIAVRAPIKIGDVIEIKGLLGTVKEMRLRDTLIRNFSGQDLMIPNKEFMSNEFANYSSSGSRKITLEIGVGYGCDLDKAKRIALDAAKAVEGVEAEPAPSAYVTSFGGSAVNLEIYLWIKYPGSDYLGIRDQAYVAAKKALDEAGVNIPFPIRTLELADSAKALFQK